MLMLLSWYGFWNFGAADTTVLENQGFVGLVIIRNLKYLQFIKSGDILERQGVYIGSAGGGRILECISVYNIGNNL